MWNLQIFNLLFYKYIIYKENCSINSLNTIAKSKNDIQ